MAATDEVAAPTAPPAPVPAPEEPSPKAVCTNEESSHHTEPESKLGSSNSLLPVLSTGEGAGAKDRDEALAKVNQDRTMSHIRAWEENEKSKSVNKYNREVSKINAWENTKKATAEAKLRKEEEALEKKRAAYVEKMKNKIAEVHRQAEEQRAIAESKKGEEFVKAEESAAKYRATGQAPKKFLCFGA